MYDKIGLKIPLIVLLVAGALFAALPLEKNMTFDGSLAEGTELVYQVVNASGSEDDAKLAKAVIEKRLNFSGLKDIRISVSGARLTVKLPGMSTNEISRYKKLIESMGELFWKIEAPAAETQKWQTNGVVPSGYGVYYPPAPTKENTEQLAGLDAAYLLSESRSIRGDQIISVTASFGEFGNPVVGFKLNGSGKESLAILSKSRGRRLVILLNNEVMTDPVINDPLTGGTGIITLGRGGDTMRTLKRRDDLIATIKAGSLKSKLEPLYQFTTAPGMGADQIEKGKKTIAATFLCVMLFMLLYYLGAGIVANVALMLNLVFVVGLMCAFDVTFTLAGIAGLILTVGMAVDANILIFERIREEKTKGKSLRQAVKSGYDKAFSTIVDANVTTLLTAMVLWGMGSVEIKGFAAVLSLGILCSMFTALVVTKVIFTLLIRANIFRSVSMLRLIGQPKIPFMSFSKVPMLISGVAIVLGLFAFFSRGEDNFGTDFLGGSRYHIVLREPMPIDQVRAQVNALAPRADIQQMEPMTIHGKVIANTEYTISIVVTEVERIGKENTDRFPQHRGQAHMIVESLLMDTFREQLVKDAWPQGDILPTYAMMVFQMQNEITESDKAKIVSVVNDLGYDGADQLDFKQPNGFVLAEVKIGSQPFADRVKAIQTALVKVDPELVFHPATPPTLAADDREGRKTVSFTVMVELFNPKEINDDVAEENLRTIFAKADQPESLPLNALGAGLQRPAIETGSPYEINTASFDRRGFEWSTTGRNFVPLTVNLLARDLKPGDPNSLKAEQGKIMRLLRLNEGGLVISPGPFARSEFVGHSIAENFKQAAFFSIILSLMVIVAYIWIRFRHLFYGLAAVAALAHDVLFTMGALAVMGYAGVEVKIDLTIIAAFLTIVGYSLNDTIVVFDRIRENSFGRHAKHYHDDVDRSINQTLSRTMLTSFSTLMVVVILAIFGGGIIRGFALSMIVGVLVGTYSSVFIASPVAVWFHDRAQKKQASENGVAKATRAAL